MFQNISPPAGGINSRGGNPEREVEEMEMQVESHYGKQRISCSRSCRTCRHLLVLLEEDVTEDLLHAGLLPLNVIDCKMTEW